MRHLKIVATSSRALRSKSFVSARMASSGGGDARKNTLAESWSTISHGYERTLVPRFAPWTRDALDALRTALPDSDKDDDSQSALVLCCGPGQELLPIARMLGPRSRVLGTDLAQGMVDAAELHIMEECKKDINLAYKECISVEVADAMHPPAGPYDVVFSAFGLQQLPDPVAAFGEWVRVLKPGGICAVVYWPPSPPNIDGKGDEGNHPFEVWSELVRKKLGSKTKEDPPWDEDLQAAVVSAGGDVIEDRFLFHDISWSDAGEMFDGMSRAGPWHALRLRRGDAFVDELGEELQSLYPAGQPLCHKFTARMIVARCQEGQKLR